MDDADDAPLVDALTSLHSLLLDTPRLEELLAKLADVAAKIVEPPASCGITTRYDGQPRTIVSTDARASVVDEYQYSLGEGPCLEALQQGVVVDVVDYSSERRWPRYADLARDAGVRASIALPLIVDGRSIGAMNLYGYDRPDTFSTADRERAAAYAEQASTTLAFAAGAVRQSQLSEQLEQALASRSVIDQALGLLMGQQRCDARTAFQLLRMHSQNNNRKLRDVAGALIARHTGRPPVDSRAFEPGTSGPVSTGESPGDDGTARDGDTRT